jgi:predicted lipoprotein with Yx(FWY)xxD motif
MGTSAAGRRAWLGAVLVCAVMLAPACASPSSSQPPGVLSASMGGNAVTLLKTARTALGTVLTNGAGYTLYWFTEDTPTSSGCGDICVTNWPPVTGAPRLAGGIRLPGTLGTIVRPDGTIQATYDDHPLYTFAGDFEPGDVGGNGTSEFGGLWYAVNVG